MLNLYTTFALALSLATIDAHMRMNKPLPRGHPDNKQYTPVDFDLVAPLGGPKPFPCGGKPAGAVVETWKAGETVTIQIGGGASHGGGHCEFALACDGADKDFRVIKRVLNDCPLAGSYPVQIPANAPSAERCTFAWSWINAIGNREYYQNCADVKIEGVSGGALTGPPLTVVNLPGYPTVGERAPAPYGELVSDPVSPIAPVAPVSPVVPAEPVAPIAPAEPVAPVAPVANNPVNPAPIVSAPLSQPTPPIVSTPPISQATQPQPLATPTPVLTQPQPSASKTNVTARRRRPLRSITTADSTLSLSYTVNFFDKSSGTFGASLTVQNIAGVDLKEWSVRMSFKEGVRVLRVFHADVKRMENGTYRVSAKEMLKKGARVVVGIVGHRKV